MIEVANKTRSLIDTRSLIEVGEMFLSYMSKSNSDFSVALVGDKSIKNLNREYRGKDKVTDVLSFEDGELVIGKRVFIGEIVIDWQQIKRQARFLNKTDKEELYFIFIHGILHLLGYEDESKVGHKRMMDLGNDFMKKLAGKYF